MRHQQEARIALGITVVIKADRLELVLIGVAGTIPARSGTAAIVPPITFSSAALSRRDRSSAMAAP
jgi:hypothetical protein